MWRLFGLISLIKGLRLNSQNRKSVLVNTGWTANNAHKNEWNLGFVRLMNRPLPFIKFIMFKGWGVLEGVTFHKAPSCWFTCFFSWTITVKISFYNRFPSLPPSLQMCYIHCFNGHMQVRCSCLLAILCFRAGVIRGQWQALLCLNCVCSESCEWINGHNCFLLFCVDKSIQSVCAAGWNYV